MVLHQARIGDTAEGGGDANAAAGFLEDDGEDEALVDVGASGNGLNTIVNGSDLSRGVVGESELGTRLLQDELAGVEPVIVYFDVQVMENGMVLTYP